MLVAPFKPLVPAAALSVKVIPPHERAVAVEVDANLVAGAALRAAALIRKRGSIATSTASSPLTVKELVEMAA